MCQYHDAKKYGYGIIFRSPAISNEELVRQIVMCRKVAQYGPDPAGSLYPRSQQAMEEAKTEAAQQLRELLAKARQRNIQGV